MYLYLRAIVAWLRLLDTPKKLSKPIRPLSEAVRWVVKWAVCDDCLPCCLFWP